jgi:rod shape-determining protein MreC
MANLGWKIARNRGYAQLPLGVVVVLVVVLLLLGKAQPSLFDRARAHVADFLAPALETARAPIESFARWVGSSGEIFTVYRENLKLKQENARLRQWHNAAIMLEERLHRYQLLLNAVSDPELSGVTAQVIGRSSRPFQETMILDAGHANGVKPGQAVVDPRGLIGRVYIVGKRTSWVILLTDVNSRVPVTIEPGNAAAIMAGDNSGEPAIEVVSQNVKLKPGAQVVSSGDGSLLPPGLPVGTLVASQGGFRVALLADSAASQDVSILDFKKPVEDMPPPQSSDLPVTAAGLSPAPSGIAPQPPQNAPLAIPLQAAPSQTTPSTPVGGHAPSSAGETQAPSSQSGDDVANQ